MVAMSKRWWIVAPLTWAAVVAVVALLAWSVIDSAGESVLADAPRDPVVPTDTSSTDDGDASDPDDSPMPGDPSDRPSRSSSPTDATSAPPSTPPTSPDTEEATETSAPTATTQTRSWQGEAGILRVSCTGPSIRLEGASPSNGYEVDKSESHGGSELDVRFRSADGDRRTEIEARCVNGVPDFAVEVDND